MVKRAPEQSGMRKAPSNRECAKGAGRHLAGKALSGLFSLSKNKLGSFPLLLKGGLQIFDHTMGDYLGKSLAVLLVSDDL